MKERIKISRETKCHGVYVSVYVCDIYQNSYAENGFWADYDYALKHQGNTVHIALQMEMCHNFLYTHTHTRLRASNCSGGSNMHSIFDTLLFIPMCIVFISKDYFIE